MKTNMIFGFMMAVAISTQAMPYGYDPAPANPPFKSIVCQAGDQSIEIEFNHDGQEVGVGSAVVVAGDVKLSGDWSWSVYPGRPRLLGYSQLTVNIPVQQGMGAFSLEAQYSYYNSPELFHGWIMINGARQRRILAVRLLSSVFLVEVHQL